MEKYQQLRNKYPNFIYHDYKINKTDNDLEITYHFEIENLTNFYPKIIINTKDVLNNYNENILNYLVFHIGLVEAISYVKATISQNIIIKAGYLDNEQIEWFKHLYFNGLGEFLYINNIPLTKDELFNFIIENKNQITFDKAYQGKGNLIPVGGGKDSNVTLEILKDLDNTPFVINPNIVQLKCIEISGIKDYISIKRVIDKNLIELNKQGFLNGHTPFSAMVAFVTYLVAYLNKKEYIILSNESSANEATIPNTNINHQYSKSFEFENNFSEYTDKYFLPNLKYFSLLRPLNELQIAKLFSKNEKYHYIFRSCNLGSKQENWPWCNNCPKCLFIYIILSPFMEQSKLIEMFGENLLDKESMLEYFKELLGHTNKKPFECVGTFEEVRYAVIKTMEKTKELPYLLKYYKENYNDKIDESLLTVYNQEHNLPDHFEKILKEVINNV